MIKAISPCRSIRKDWFCSASAIARLVAAWIGRSPLLSGYHPERANQAGSLIRCLQRLRRVLGGLSNRGVGTGGQFLDPVRHSCQEVGWFLPVIGGEAFEGRLDNP